MEQLTASVRLDEKQATSSSVNQQKVDIEKLERQVEGL
jgi:hypothetical protein